MLLFYPLLAILPVLAPSALALALVMVVFGYFNTTVDVVMNAHGVALETRSGKSIMSGLHAGWSLGGVIGAVGVALALGVGLEPLVEVVIAALLLWLVALGASRFLGHGSVREEGTWWAPSADTRRSCRWRCSSCSSPSSRVVLQTGAVSI